MYLHPNKRVHSWESLTISEFITKKNVQLIFFVVKLPKTPRFLPSNVVGAFWGFFLYVLGVSYVEEELTLYKVLHFQEVLTHFISCYIKWVNNIWKYSKIGQELFDIQKYCSGGFNPFKRPRVVIERGMEIPFLMNTLPCVQ